MSLIKDCALCMLGLAGVATITVVFSAFMYILIKTAEMLLTVVGVI